VQAIGANRPRLRIPDKLEPHPSDDLLRQTIKAKLLAGLSVRSPWFYVALFFINLGAILLAYWLGGPEGVRAFFEAMRGPSAD
jgi:hypothetical protein